MSKSIQEFIEKASLRCHDDTVKFVKEIFKKQEEIAPLIFSIQFKELNGEPERSMVHVGDYFAQPKHVRDFLIGGLIEKYKPMIFVLISECWMDYRPEDKPNLDILPSVSPTRQEAVLIHVQSPYGILFTNIVVNSDFQNIKNGVPAKSLGEILTVNSVDNGYESVFGNIYKRFSYSKEQLERKLS